MVQPKAKERQAALRKAKIGSKQHHFAPHITPIPSYPPPRPPRFDSLPKPTGSMRGDNTPDHAPLSKNLLLKTVFLRTPYKSAQSSQEYTAVAQPLYSKQVAWFLRILHDHDGDPNSFGYSHLTRLRWAQSNNVRRESYGECEDARGSTFNGASG